MTKDMLFNGASPMKSNHSSYDCKQKNQNLTFAEILYTDVTDQLYQAKYGIGKREISG